jgi:hypothetical protein
VLYEKFWKTISRLLPPGVLKGNLEALSQLDPGHIDIENVRSVLGVSREAARRFCESAVRQGFFLRRVAVSCPDGSIAATADDEDHLPPTVRCYVQDGDFLRETEIASSELPRHVFYQLANGTHARTA